MSFTLPQYHEPDFQETRFQSAPEARFEPAPKDGVAPEGYHATTIYPEYFKVGGRWLLAEESRMDCVAALRDGKIAAVEFRNLKAGEPVAVGRTEDASEGIYVYPFGFAEEKGEAETFAFRQGRSRETAYSMDYDSIYELLRHEKEHGRILWVMGPACAFDHDARAAFAALVRGGYVHGLLAGNALATHDLEASYLGTALGQDIYTQKSMPSACAAPPPPSWRRARRRTALSTSACATTFLTCWWAPSGMTALCPRSMETCMKGRTPCAPWCGRPPRLSAWPPPSIPWPPAT